MELTQKNSGRLLLNNINFKSLDSTTGQSDDIRTCGKTNKKEKLPLFDLSISSLLPFIYCQNLCESV